MSRYLWVCSDNLQTGLSRQACMHSFSSSRFSRRRRSRKAAGNGDGRQTMRSGRGLSGVDKFQLVALCQHGFSSVGKVRLRRHCNPVNASGYGVCTVGFHCDEMAVERCGQLASTNNEGSPPVSTTWLAGKALTAAAISSAVIITPWLWSVSQNGQLRLHPESAQTPTECRCRILRLERL